MKKLSMILAVIVAASCLFSGCSGNVKPLEISGDKKDDLEDVYEYLEKIPSEKDEYTMDKGLWYTVSCSLYTEKVEDGESETVTASIHGKFFDTPLVFEQKCDLKITFDYLEKFKDGSSTEEDEDDSSYKLTTTKRKVQMDVITLEGFGYQKYALTLDYGTKTEKSTNYRLISDVSLDEITEDMIFTDILEVLSLSDHTETKYNVNKGCIEGYYSSSDSTYVKKCTFRYQVNEKTGVMNALSVYQYTKTKTSDGYVIQSIRSDVKKSLIGTLVFAPRDSWRYQA